MFTNNSKSNYKAVSSVSSYKRPLGASVSSVSPTIACTFALSCNNMASKKVLFVLGAGGNIGAALAKKFLHEGYKVALASRTAEPGLRSDGTFGVRLDLAKPADVGSAFDAVKEQLGAPSVVVYNGRYNTLCHVYAYLCASVLQLAI